MVTTDDAGARLAAAARDRLPDWPLWLPLLRFLDARSDDCIRLVPLEVASICECWLRWGGPEWPYRKEAARIALRIANELLDDHFRYGSDQGRLAHLAFFAAMAGYNDRPDEVLACCVDASGRIGKPLHTPDFEQEGRKYLRPRSIIYGDAMEIPDPWPDGPVARRHNTFAAVCLKETGLLPIVVSAPELAVEVLLALLIEPPRPRSRHDSLT